MSSDSPARRRALARLKVLTTVSAATVAASCTSGSGYGVVDPLPQPTCFQSEVPTATATYTTDGDGGAGDAGAGDGSRLVQLNLRFQEKVEVGIYTSNQQVTQVSNVVTPTGARLVLRVEKGVASALGRIPINCGEGRSSLDISLTLQTTDVLVSVSKNQ